MSDEPNNPEYDLDDGDEPAHQDRTSGWPKSLRRVLGSGMQALTGSDDGGRGMFGELKLPKEALQFLAQQTEKTRRELFRVMANEVKSAVGRTNMLRDLRHALLGLKVQVKADITFTRDEPKTKIRTKVSSRKSKEKKTQAAKAEQAPDPEPVGQPDQSQNSAASQGDSTNTDTRT